MFGFLWARGRALCAGFLALAVIACSSGYAMAQAEPPDVEITELGFEMAEFVPLVATNIGWGLIPILGVIMALLCVSALLAWLRKGAKQR